MASALTPRGRKTAAIPEASSCFCNFSFVVGLFPEKNIGTLMSVFGPYMLEWLVS